jgi:predicted glycoside hydrolase/deacetylase ChbG (UPF0249 family)
MPGMTNSGGFGRPARLVVNADDFGLTQGINAETIRCIEDGIVTSVSIMPTGFAFDEACALASRYVHRAGIGVHLTLDGMPSVSRAGDVATLIDKNQRFFSRAQIIARLLTGRSLRSEVRREWAAQIEKVIDAGLPIDHLDGHGHLHVLPPLVDIVVELAEKHHIRAVRMPWDRFGGGRPYERLPGRIALRASALYAKSIFKGRLRFADSMIGFSCGGNYSEDLFLRDLEHIGVGEIVEAMFHPGPQPIDHPDLKTWGGYQWEVDSATLRSERVRNRLAEQGVALVRYGDIS